MHPDDLRGILPPARVDRLGNGLRLCVVDNPRVPLVATALAYRAGTRDEASGCGGTAHFLEHMMFKGSPRFGPGEIDQLTQVLGGANNAFTTHDMTLYHFTFATDRWRQALAVEADRMAALTLDPIEVDGEREVIREEIAMYESEPWDVLEQRVAETFHGPHPYARSVLGTRGELATVDAGVLSAFHRRYYRPGNAVLAVAGRVGDRVRDEVVEAFAALDDPLPPAVPEDGGPSVAPQELVRIERRHGEVARLLLALPAPATGDPEHPLLRLLVGILGSGRASRLHRALVDEGQLCVWVAAEVSDTIDPGAVTIGAEVLPGVEPARVEEEVRRQIDGLRTVPPDGEEVARVKKIITADWVFGHEKVDQLAALTATAVVLYDLEHPWRYLERLLAATPEALRALTERWLRPEVGGVAGWSLPES